MMLDKMKEYHEELEESLKYLDELISCADMHEDYESLHLFREMKKDLDEHKKYLEGRIHDKRREEERHAEKRTDKDVTDDDLFAWAGRLHNTDGTVGAHFSMSQIHSLVAEHKMPMEGYNEFDVFVAANMLYSDYGSLIKTLVPYSKEGSVFVKMAKEFLEDDDGLRGREKLKEYYRYIAK